MPESKNSQRLTKPGKPRKTKKYKSAFYLPRQNPYFCLKCLKIKKLWDFESDLYPYFIRVPRKAKFC